MTLETKPQSDILVVFTDTSNGDGYYLKVASRYPTEQAHARGEEYLTRIRKYLHEGVKVHVEVEPSRFRHLVNPIANQGLVVRVKGDGVWICFKSSTGKEHAINIEGLIIENSPRISMLTLREWCDDQRSREKVEVKDDPQLSLPLGAVVVCKLCKEQNKHDNWLACGVSGCPMQENVS